MTLSSTDFPVNILRTAKIMRNSNWQLVSWKRTQQRIKLSCNRVVSTKFQFMKRIIVKLYRKQI